MQHSYTINTNSPNETLCLTILQIQALFVTLCTVFLKAFIIVFFTQKKLNVPYKLNVWN